jgi:hypothetical protein
MQRACMLRNSDYRTLFNRYTLTSVDEGETIDKAIGLMKRQPSLINHLNRKSL